MKIKKKIALIFATGSLVSIRNNKSIFFVEKKEDIESWIVELPELSLLADVTTFFIQGENEQFTIKSIEEIIRTLLDQRDLFDGFVILVRGENMIRASIGVEFMLQGFGKPIVFTGSRYSQNFIAQQDIKKIVKQGGLGLRSNIINAFQVAASPDFPATAIMFGNKLIKPTDAVVNSFNAMNLFRSRNDSYLGKVDFGISLNRNTILTLPEKFETKLFRDITMRSYADVLYGSEWEDLGSMNKNKSSIVLIHIRENELLGSDFLERLKARYSMVVLFNEHYTFDSDRVISISGMTWETVIMKLMWVCSLYKDTKKRKEMLYKNVIGEFQE